MLLTTDKNLKPLLVHVWVGKVVDVVGQIDRPKTITGVVVLVLLGVIHTFMLLLFAIASQRVMNKSSSVCLIGLS